MARCSSSLGLRGNCFFQLRCGFTGSPFLSSVIMYVSSPPYDGSARRVRSIESRTQNTNCLYSELVTSVSSIQKPSTEMSFTGVCLPQRLSCCSIPILSHPLFTRVMPNGAGSRKLFPPPTPVTSPPLPEVVADFPPKQAVMSVTVIAATHSVSIVLRNFIYIVFLLSIYFRSRK